MGFPQLRMNQDAVYWGNPDTAFAGAVTYDDPVEVKVRWDKKQELFRTQAGEERMSTDVVLVDRSVEVGGMLFLGTLADLDSAHEDDPSLRTDTYRVEQFEELQSLRGNRTVVKAWL